MTVTGRCYCGRTTLAVRSFPQVVAYCHCSDCRRWTGAPVAAFAAFAEADLSTIPALGPAFSAKPGIDRWSCPACSSPLAARFDYLPDQVYVPVGVLDRVQDFPPQMHCHDGSRVPWLHIDDDLERVGTSGRDALRRGV